MISRMEHHILPSCLQAGMSFAPPASAAPMAPATGPDSAAAAAQRAALLAANPQVLIALMLFMLLSLLTATLLPQHMFSQGLCPKPVTIQVQST